MLIPDFTFEKKLWKNFDYIAGADEVGRGSFAGPVVAGAVVFEKNTKIPDDIVINDSKKMNYKKRKTVGRWIRRNALCWGVGEASVNIINKKGIVAATNTAFRRAVKKANDKIKTSIQYLLIDAYYVPYTRHLPIHRNSSREGRQKAVKGGDGKSISIAAASIVAKVYRDNIMEKMAERGKYKRYGWASNKGYATKKHREALLKHGPTSYHREQFVETFFSNL